MRVSKRIGAVLAAAALLTAGGASASKIEHVDPFDDFASTWRVDHAGRTQVEQGDGAVTVSAGEARRWYGIDSIGSFSPATTKLAFDYDLIEGTLDALTVRIVRYDAAGALLGIDNLPMDPHNRRWLSRDVDMSSTDHFRVQMLLAPGTQVELSELKVISGAPEPTAALLLAMGMTVTGMHMRGRKSL